MFAAILERIQWFGVPPSLADGSSALRKSVRADEGEVAALARDAWMGAHSGSPVGEIHGIGV